MFGKKKQCMICGEKLHTFGIKEMIDGEICSMCARICENTVFASVNDVKKAWEENTRRVQQFHQSKVITSMMHGCIFIDWEHHWAYVAYNNKKSKVNPIIFHFSEIKQYTIDAVGQKTVTTTRTKGGITRAIIGNAIVGPVGAIVGATTAKKETQVETKGGTPILYINLDFGGLQTRVSLVNPSEDIKNALDAMMNFSES